MQTKTPRPRRISRSLSPVGPGIALRGEQPPRLGGVVAAEVDRLADLGDAVVQRLAALAGQQRHQPVALAPRSGRPAGRGRRRARPPARATTRAKPSFAARHDRVDRFNRQLHHVADTGLSVDRADDRPRRSPSALPRGGQRPCGDRRSPARRHAGEQRAELGGAAEFQPRRVLRGPARRGRAAAGTRLWRTRPPPSSSAAGRRQQVVHRHVGIADHRDEGGIGAVLEQPADEIGEQFAMAADRRVDAARRPRVVACAAPRTASRPCRAGAGTRSRIGVAGHLEDGGDGQRVVAGELRIDARAERQQPPGAGEIERSVAGLRVNTG